MNKCLLCSEGGGQRYPLLPYSVYRPPGIPCDCHRRYQPNSRMVMCHECPKNTQLIFDSKCTSVTDCICQRGFWRPDGKRGKECFACAAGCLALTCQPPSCMCHPSYEHICMLTRMCTSTRTCMHAFRHTNSYVHICKRTLD